MCLILHRDKTDVNVETGEIVPSQKSVRQTKKELYDLRKDMKNNALIIYSYKDRETGAIVYFNMTTMEYFLTHIRRIEKIIKGIYRNKKAGLELLKMSRKERNKIAKLKADQYRNEQLRKIQKNLAKERQDELKEIIKKYDEGIIKVDNTAHDDDDDDDEERKKKGSKKSQSIDKKIEQERVREDEISKSIEEQEQEEGRGEQEENE